MTLLKAVYSKIEKLLEQSEGIINPGKRLAPCIIILQPGKVGSITVEESLKEAYRKLNVPATIHRAHALNFLDERENFIKKTRKKTSENIAAIAAWRRIRQNIDRHPEKNLKIINLVRDPVALKVSALFQIMENYIPDWTKRLKAGNLRMADLDDLFYTKKEFGFSGLERWHDQQIKALWGIDVYASAFPTENGYQFYQSRNVDLLLIRLEDLNKVSKQVFNQFLGLEEFEIISTNIGTQKPYAELYKEFKKRPLHEDFINQAYATRFARHFYAPQEIERFRRAWLHPEAK